MTKSKPSLTPKTTDSKWPKNQPQPNPTHKFSTKSFFFTIQSYWTTHQWPKKQYRSKIIRPKTRTVIDPNRSMTKTKWIFSGQMIRPKINLIALFTFQVCIRQPIISRNYKNYQVYMCMCIFIHTAGVSSPWQICELKLDGWQIVFIRIRVPRLLLNMHN